MPATPNDAAIRQQIYFEAVKNYENDHGAEVGAVAVTLVAAALARLGVSHLYELTKTQFNALLVSLRKQLTQKFAGLKKSTISRFRAIMRAEWQLTKSTFASVANGEAFKAPRETVGTLWAKIANDRIGGTGELPLDAINAYYSAAGATVLVAVQKGYSDKKTVEEINKSLRGTKALNFRDGVAVKLARQYAALAETVLQHVSSFINQTLGRLVSRQYVWLSVLDGNTTDICRGRNGKIYTYGQGPQPPAHFRCRSRTRPYFAAVPTVPQSFYAWITRQPKPFLSDVFGSNIARRILSGDIKAEQMPKYENNLRMTPEQYKTKKNLITS